MAPDDTWSIETRSERRVRWVLGAVAVILVLAAAFLPVWQAKLKAPQYPKGLHLTAWGTKVEGDIAEINELNHYVGMSAFSMDDVPETALWYPAMMLAVIGVIVGSVLARRNLVGKLARIGLWLVPIGALVDVQYRLYVYGRSMDPKAAIRLDPFIPKVIGSTKVLNFTTLALPGTGVWCLFGAAFLVMFGPGLVRRANAALENRREERAGTTAPVTG